MKHCNLTWYNTRLALGRCKKMHYIQQPAWYAACHPWIWEFTFLFAFLFFYSKAKKSDFIVKREICQCTLLSPSEGFDEIKLGLPVVNDFSHVILGRSTSSSFPNVALSWSVWPQWKLENWPKRSSHSQLDFGRRKNLPWNSSVILFSNFRNV